METSAAIEVAEEPGAFQAVASKEPSLTLDEAAARIGPDVLQALESKFNGSLTEVRTPDAKDQLF